MAVQEPGEVRGQGDQRWALFQLAQRIGLLSEPASQLPKGP